jgi:hypothetical protein
MTRIKNKEGPPAAVPPYFFILKQKAPATQKTARDSKSKLVGPPGLEPGTT